MIQSIALHPRHDGTVWLARRHSPGARAVGDEWPLLPAATVVTVHDTQGWCWTVELSAPITDGGPAAMVMGKVVGGRTPLPMPELSEQADGSARITLPNIGGHAHVRSWRAGDIVRVHGRAWKVRGKPQPRNAHSRLSYTLAPVAESAWATRPGRIPFDSEFAANQAVGTAVQTKGEWLHVKKITRTSFYGACGRGYTYWANGSHVSAEKAAKINARH